MDEKERWLRSNILWFRIGLVATVIGIVMMFFDSSIAYAEESLLYIIRPCYIMGDVLVITGLVFAILSTVEFYHIYVKGGV